MAEDGLPQYWDLLWPALQVVAELGGSAPIGEITKTVIKRQGINDARQAIFRKGRPDTQVAYRIGRACSNLEGMGLLVSSVGRVWALTDEGTALSVGPAATNNQRRDQVHTLWQSYLSERRKAQKVRESGDLTNSGMAQLSWKPYLKQPTKLQPATCQPPLNDTGVKNINVQSAEIGSKHKHRVWPLSILILLLLTIAGASTFLGFNWRPTTALNASSVDKTALSNQPVISEIDLATNIPVPGRATLIAEPTKIVPYEVFHSENTLLLSFDIQHTIILKWALRIWARTGSAPQIVNYRQPSGTHIGPLRYEGDTMTVTYHQSGGSPTTANYKSYTISGTIAGPTSGYTLSNDLNQVLLPGSSGNQQAFQVVLPLRWRGSGLVTATQYAVTVQTPVLVSKSLKAYAPDPRECGCTPWGFPVKPFHWQLGAQMSEPVQEVTGPPATWNDGYNWNFNDTTSQDDQVRFYGENTFAGYMQSNSAFRSGLALGVAGAAIVAALQAGATLLFERNRRGDNLYLYSRAAPRGRAGQPRSRSKKRQRLLTKTVESYL